MHEEDTAPADPEELTAAAENLEDTLEPNEDPSGDQQDGEEEEKGSETEQYIE